MVQKNLIYDVGMHKGNDTDYYLKKGFKVIAFEADPQLILFCKDRFRDEINSGQLIIVEGAIVDPALATEKKEKVRFFENKGNSEWGTVCQNWVDRNERSGKPSCMIEVPVTDFAACLNRYGIPYYLKIDIEGMDILCLKALLLFRERPDFVSLESNKVDFRKLKEEFNLLCELGYNSFQAVNQAKIPNSKEPLDTKEGRFVGYVFPIASSGAFGKDLPISGWMKRKKILLIYRWIFLKYKFWGPDDRYARWHKNLFGKIYYRILGFGWYDTHARRCDR
ncbi:FkbM family methyltransferase [uncultured Parabacteroides sp.]|jgi:FkbM family methyltransferase|uniref:FkbM family methyltransferase n=1 Tax=uncultured Parabacteroides sp. TaxID=512312 RepID=UPI0025F98EBE|nr:FkbM family methyltransferase [uncultured Parabacteroides sp.]